MAGSRGASHGDRSAVLSVIRAVLVDQDSAVGFLGEVFAQDQAEFFDLMVQLADFAALCMQFRGRAAGAGCGIGSAGPRGPAPGRTSEDCPGRRSRPRRGRV
ncbi:hypothetical protein M878_42575 [Streptomyces roseochromogenus subsp. oscitans DS 12.976]|uniref:Uncharacterized protein n=1 Tax=Streptomyces roseochromogenus subsp. oscitans DS 12.976 TaxID=1352936 RepID=V6JQN8_STRRC|nr:hypothetical protein M878_42575 [Streptomyces roseochromogenus subsp. oscitans DS 12.976]